MRAYWNCRSNSRGDVAGAAWMSDPGADRAFLRLADATTAWRKFVA